jgi:hypothetical protein
MTMRVWAIKNGDLKPLSRGGLLLFAARCALRVEPWSPPGAEALWRRALEHIVTAALGNVANPAAARKLERTLSDQGALGAHAVEASDEPLGECIDYAATTLATGVAATALEARPALLKSIIDCAKLSASVPAVLAHAGRVPVAKGRDAVEAACTPIWRAIRSDLPILAILATSTNVLESASDRVSALREIAPLWVEGKPDWVPRARSAS